MKSIFIILFLLPLSAFCQKGGFKCISTINVEADLFTSDNQGNVYVVKKDELIKYNKEGKELYKYSNKNLGNISYVDASNMLRILVYYQDFSQVVFLDNTLTLNTEPVSFDKLGYQQVSLACTSHNNGMWIYNQQNFSLILLNTTYEKVQQTDNLSTVLNIELQPTEMVEYDNKLYINNPASGILIFDIYGTYYKTVPAKNVTHFQAIRDLVYYIQKDDMRLRAYNVKTTEESEFVSPATDFDAFRLGTDILMLRTKEGIKVYVPVE